MQAIALDRNGHHQLARAGARVRLVSTAEQQRSDLRWALGRHLALIVDGVVLRLAGRGDGLGLDLAPGARRLELRLGAAAGERLAGRDLATGAAVGPDRPLSAFVCRYLADNDAPPPAVAVPGDLPRPRTDLHTHLAGCVAPADLLDLAARHGIAWPATLLARAGIVAAGDLGPDDLSAGPRQGLRRALALGLDRAVPFRALQAVYALRQPVTKSRAAFADFLGQVARDYRAMGVEYVELSFHQLVFPDWLARVHDCAPRAEAETGVQLRFLAAFGRDDDGAWIRDYCQRIQRAGRSRYLVGVDVNGHEVNSTRRFAEHLSALADWADGARPGFVIRVHAGENPAHPENMRLAAAAVAGRAVSLRIGHGLYGADDRTLDALRAAGALVEFNLNSNFALNNVQALDLSHTPIRRYVDAGVAVVLGTDGYGIYQTSLAQEAEAALRCGLSAADLARIGETETDYLRRRARWDAAVTDGPGDFVPPAALAPAEMAYDEGAIRTAREEAQRVREQALTGRLARNGTELLSEGAGRARLRKKQVISFAGAWKKSWARIAPADQRHIEQTVEALVAAWDPARTVLLTGGTRHGLEARVQRLARARGIPLLATLVQQTRPDDLDPDLEQALLFDGSLYAKAAGLYRLIQDHHGWCVFIGGGAIVGDEIQTARNLHLRLLLMDGPAGASSEHARQLPAAAFRSAAEALARMEQQRPRSDLWFAGENPAVDLVVVRSLDGDRRQVLLIRRADDGRENAGAWALPGGFQPSAAELGQPWQAGMESPRQTAVRELFEESGLDLRAQLDALIPVGRYADRDRDPRNTDRAWVSSQAFAILLRGAAATAAVAGGDDAGAAAWLDLDPFPDQLAFDHPRILRDALTVLRM